MLLVGTGYGELGYLLKKRPGVQVHGVESDPRLAEAARISLDSVVQGAPGGFPLPFPEGYFDAIVVDAKHYSRRMPDMLGVLIPYLDVNGLLFVLLPNLDYWAYHVTPSRPQGIRIEDLLRCAGQYGLVPYHHWPVEDQAFLGLEPDAQGNAAIHGHVINTGQGISRERMGCIEFLILFARADADPIGQARGFVEAGRPDWAFQALSLIPEGQLESPRAELAVITEMLVSLARWAQRDATPKQLDFAAKGQELFYRGAALDPLLPALYQCQAELWRLAGREDMAARLLRSIQYVASSESVEKQLSALAPAGAVSMEEPPPAWACGSFRPRILYVIHPRFHYGLDVLYDGLCNVLGDERVVDFPYKPFLHGVVPDTLAHYPCSFNRPGTACDLEEILAQLRARAFDLILYGDCEQALDVATARQIAEAAGDIPVFVVDALDAMVNARSSVQWHLGLGGVAGYFKREMLAGADYGPNTFPLPFAYPENRLPSRLPETRTRAFFWAGHQKASLRRLYIERIEAMLNETLETYYPPDQYVDILRDTRIGLNCFGFGFDTVRYWELPAQGCMLLSERPPIRIPHNFRDGENAVFFDDVRELEEKLAYYLERPEETAAVAAAGHDHLERHHTGSARARQLLGCVGSVLRR